MPMIPGGGGGAAPPPVTDPWSLPYYEEPAPWDAPAPPQPPPPYAPPYGYTPENQPVPPPQQWGSSSDRGRGQPAAPPPPSPFAGWAAQRYGAAPRDYPWMRQGERMPWAPTPGQAAGLPFYEGWGPPPPAGLSPQEAQMYRMPGVTPASWGAPGYGPPPVGAAGGGYGPGIGPPSVVPPGMNRWVTPRGVVWLPPGQDPSGGFAPPGGGAAEQPVAQQPWGPGAGGPGGGGGRDGGGEGGAEAPETEGLGEYRPVYAPFEEEGGTVAVLQPDDYMSLPEFVRPYLGQILEKLGWKAELIGQWGPYRFTRADAWRMWITMADLDWITDFRARQWLMAFFGQKGWAEMQEGWPPEILDEPPTH